MASYIILPLIFYSFLLIYYGKYTII